MLITLKRLQLLIDTLQYYKKCITYKEVSSCASNSYPLNSQRRARKKALLHRSTHMAMATIIILTSIFPRRDFLILHLCDNKCLLPACLFSINNICMLKICLYFKKRTLLFRSFTYPRFKPLPVLISLAAADFFVFRDLPVCLFLYPRITVN